MFYAMKEICKGLYHLKIGDKHAKKIIKLIKTIDRIESEIPDTIKHDIETEDAQIVSHVFKSIDHLLNARDWFVVHHSPKAAVHTNYIIAVVLEDVSIIKMYRKAKRYDLDICNKESIKLFMHTMYVQEMEQHV